MLRLTRRQAVAGAVAGLSLGGAGIGLVSARPRPMPLAFDGRHQAGIRSEPLDHLTLAAFDLNGPDPTDLQRLLREWTTLVRQLVDADSVRGDTGERVGLQTGPITVTIGFGASLFEGRIRNRSLPAGLADTGLTDDRLDPSTSDGDLLIQICADDRQLVAHARRQLANAALGLAHQRWVQHGFRSRLPGSGQTRNLFGFIDGTANLDTGDREALARHVWVSDTGPLTGGTYLVYRRIRFRLTAWDRKPLGEQERVVGRRKATGGPLGGKDGEERRLALEEAPLGSHVRAVHPDANGGATILRRSYNFDDGVTEDGATDAGMVFICFAADPRHQVARLLARMEREDRMNEYLEHTAGGVFAIPPAPAPGEFVGERLLG